MAIKDVKDRRIYELENQVVDMQARVAYIEIARDNVVSNHEELQARTKKRGVIAGRIIAELKELVVSVARNADDQTRLWAHERLDTILEKKAEESNDHSSDAAVHDE